MDSDRVNRWLTLGANIGVLIGIILLIVELNLQKIILPLKTTLYQLVRVDTIRRIMLCLLAEVAIVKNGIK